MNTVYEKELWYFIIIVITFKVYYDFDDLNYPKYSNYLNLNYAYMHRQLSQSDAHD